MTELTKTIDEHSNICRSDNCVRACFKQEKHCALHTIKGSYHKDNSSGLLNSFFYELIDYIKKPSLEYYNGIKGAKNLNLEEESYYLEQYFTSSSEKFNEFNQKYAPLPSDRLKKFISLHQHEYQGGIVKIDSLIKYYQKFTVHFNNILFPERDDRDPFDYLKVLEKISKLHFDGCEFNTSYIDLPKQEIFYQNCTFISNWYLSNTQILQNINQVVYQECTFRDEVSILPPDSDDVSIIENTLFNDCLFEQSLIFENTKFISPIFNNISNISNAERLYIQNCTIEDSFILNNLNTKYLLIEDTEFKSKVELKEGEVFEISISNSNFEKTFDSFKTKYNKFSCDRSTFSDVVAFEQCEFSTPESDTLSQFRYSTFTSFTNFRKTTFFSGLCLEEANFKEPPNFLNISLEPTNTKVLNTSRETLRIIKYSFERLGNQIESNKYFVHEMKKYKQEVKENKGRKQDRLILLANEFISNFGQSYVRPIVLYLVMVILYSSLRCGLENNILYVIYPEWNHAFSYVSNIFNKIALSFLPFKSFLHPGMEFLSLIIYIIFAILTWQIIVAVKRHTKR